MPCSSQMTYRNSSATSQDGPEDLKFDGFASNVQQLTVNAQERHNLWQGSACSIARTA